MCKIITLTNVSQVTAFRKLTRVASELVGQTEVDGFGYAVQTSRGVFGERSVNPEEFTPTSGLKPAALPFAKPVRNSFGAKGQLNGAAMFHGRTSTNDRTLLNTHPLLKHGWTLIHNGVVTNHGRKYKRKTTNDTEDLVEYMAKEGLAGIAENLTGYYAFTAIAPDGRLHVVRDSTASLYVAQVESIDSLIFATSERHILDLCKQMEWQVSYTSEVDENTHLIFQEGNLVDTKTFTPGGRTSYESKWASASLGRELSEENYYGSTYDASSHASRFPNLDQLDAVNDYLTQDEEMFLAELSDHGDDSYLIMNRAGETINITEFKELSVNDQLNCRVVRPDGTVCDQADYYTDKVYEGAS